LIAIKDLSSALRGRSGVDAGEGRVSKRRRVAAPKARRGLRSGGGIQDPYEDGVEDDSTPGGDKGDQMMSGSVGEEEVAPVMGNGLGDREEFLSSEE
jgi:hypothetical protein